MLMRILSSHRPPPISWVQRELSPNGCLDGSEQAIRADGFDRQPDSVGRDVLGDWLQWRRNSEGACSDRFSFKNNRVVAYLGLWYLGRLVCACRTKRGPIKICLRSTTHARLQSYALYC